MCSMTEACTNSSISFFSFLQQHEVASFAVVLGYRSLETEMIQRLWFRQFWGDVRLFKIAENNFDLSLMILPSPVWKPVGENSHQSYSCQSLRSVAAARCLGSCFNNYYPLSFTLAMDCLKAIWSTIGATELLQTHWKMIQEVDGHLSCWFTATVSVLLSYIG